MDGVKHGVDIAGAGAALLSVLHAIPDVLAAIASALTIIWYSIRVFEYIKGRQK